MIQVVETEHCGRGVVATERLDPSGPAGLEVVREAATVVFIPHGSQRDQSPPVPPPLAGLVDPQDWTNYWWFQQHSAEVQNEVLTEFYSNGDCKEATTLQCCLLGCHSSLELDVEEFVKVAMIVRHNGVAMHPAAPHGRSRGKFFGVGLCKLSCTINHSCHPNCVWFTAQNGRDKIVRVIAPIEVGEELLVDYGGDLLLPTHLRRAKLQSTKGFVCECSRCNNDEQETRWSYCETKSTTSSSCCSGTHFIIQPHMDTVPIMTNCSKCHHEASSKHLQKVLELELELHQEIDKIEHIADQNLPMDVSGRIMALKPPHPYHYLAEMTYKIQGELYGQLQQWDAAVQANTRFVACRDANLKPTIRKNGDNENYHDVEYASEVTAFACARLAASLLGTRHYTQAEQIHQRELRILMRTHGGTVTDPEPYVANAVRKILLVQQHLYPAPSTTTTTSSNDFSTTTTTTTTASHPQLAQKYCALCGTKAALTCSRCGKVVYCCRDRQKLSWSKVHKKHCVLK